MSELPLPGWLSDGARFANPRHVQWRYPFHMLREGQAIFVTERAGLAAAAIHAVHAYARILRKHGLPGRVIGYRHHTTCEGIRGVIIQRGREYR